MRMIHIVTLASLSLLLTAAPAFADLGGCVDSPENPSWILGLLGGAAAGLLWLRARLSRRLRRGVD
ncbi:MAG: hypothetical protein JWR07_1705 [Nevskia sp.]|nr:hypothetical protein [Nevskia sp.]